MRLFGAIDGLVNRQVDGSMALISKTVLVLTLLTLATGARAREIDIPVRFEADLIRQILISQAYTDRGVTARAWDDGHGCGYLTLSDPVVSVEKRGLRVKSAARARVGLAFADRCLALLDWAGFVEVLEQPDLSARPGVVEFKVTDSRIYGPDGQSSGVTGTLWDWVKRYVHPRLERLRLDLNSALRELESLVPLVFPDDERLARELLDSIALSGARAVPGHVILGVSFIVPAKIRLPATPVGSEPALTADELQHWRQAARDWDAFLTLVIKRAGMDVMLKEQRAQLLEVLLDARRDMLNIVARSPRLGADPVRGLFIQTWTRLAPILRAQTGHLPADSALRWLSFITAGDALKTFGELSEDLGFKLSAAALRRLARIALSDPLAEPLEYSNAVDTELRRALGFVASLPRPRRNPAVDLGMLLIDPVHAAEPLDALAERLNGWVPSLSNLKEYLPLAGELLGHAAQDAMEAEGLEPQYRGVYQPLVLATAWQESCWRQFIRDGDKLVPIVSGTGSVGIMQINQHVWRGFYDIAGLQQDIAYNARAGAEILRHYLVDYAVRKEEHTASGDIQNLARATYAMYNGGPSQMTRYRMDTTPDSVAAIDTAFWKKYQTIKSGDPLAVATCYLDQLAAR
jgi:soluble lytic murein transglycosylase-like protein